MTPKFVIVLLLLVLTSLTNADEDVDASNVADKNDSGRNDDKVNDDDKGVVTNDEATDASDTAAEASTEDDRNSNKSSLSKSGSDEEAKEGDDKIEQESKDAEPVPLTSKNHVNLEFLQKASDKSEVFSRTGEVFEHSLSSDVTYVKNAEVSNKSDPKEVESGDENSSDEEEPGDKIEKHDRNGTLSEETNLASEEKISLKNPASLEKSEIGLTGSILDISDRSNEKSDDSREKATSSNERNGRSDASHETKSINVDEDGNSEEKSDHTDGKVTSSNESSGESDSNRETSSSNVSEDGNVEEKSDQTDEKVPSSNESSYGSDSSRETSSSNVGEDGNVEEKSNQIDEKATSSNERSGTSQTSDEIANVENSKKNEDDNESELLTELFSKAEASNARKVEHKEDKADSDESPNIDRLGFGLPGEHALHHAPKRVNGLTQFPILDNSHHNTPFGLFGPGNRQRDLISPRPAYRPPIRNPLYNPNSFNLPNYPGYYNGRNFGQNDDSENFDPYSNSYPYAPNQGTANIIRNQLELPAHKYANLYKYPNYSPIKHPLYGNRERRNTNIANASPFFGYFKEIFDNFRLI